MSDGDSSEHEATEHEATEHEATEHEATEHEATEKSGGLGSDGTIPPDEQGVAAGMSGENSNFNVEEDPDQVEDETTTS